MAQPASPEGGLDDLLLRQLVAAEIGDDAAVAEDIDVVAIVQLFGFGRVPEECAARLAPPRGSARRPRAWCRYRRRASGRPSGRCWHRSRARGRTGPSAGCRRTARGCCCGCRACGCRSSPASLRPSSASRSREIRRPLRSRAIEPMPMFSAIDHSGKMPSDWRSPATSATGRGHLDAGPGARRRGEDRQQQVASGHGRKARRDR